MSARTPSSATPGRVKISSFLSIALTFGLTAGVSRAEPLGYTMVPSIDGDWVLARLDVESGQLTPIGPNDRQVTPMALLPSGVLVGVDLLENELVQIDPATGQVAPVGWLGEEAPPVLGLTADACGRLWTVGASFDPLQWTLYEIDPSTGSAQARGDLPEEISALAAEGGRLYGIAESRPEPWIVEIDPATAALSDVAEITGFPRRLGSLGIDFSAAGTLVEIAYEAFPPGPIPTSPFPRAIYHYDLTGQPLGAPVLPSFPFLRGLALRPPPGRCADGSALPIPTASPLALAALAAGLSVFGALLLYRRRSITWPG